MDDDSDLALAADVEFVDATGIRRSIRVVDGQTTISGIAPLLVTVDASPTRANRAFRSQSSITDPEAFAFLNVGYRINYGEGRGGTWRYPEGLGSPRDEDLGPPVFARVYENPGTFTARLRAADSLGNERTISFRVQALEPPASVTIQPSAGRWPALSSGTRYFLIAGADYRSFGPIDTGGLHNISFEKTGAGADPLIAEFRPDGRSKFSSTSMFERRAAHIRLRDIDVQSFSEGQRGFDYVGVIGGVIRQYSYGGHVFLWAEGSETIRSNVRYSRGLFLQGTEVRSTAAGSGYVMFATMRGLHARDTRFVHMENGSTTYAMLRIYGSYNTFRNNLWTLAVDSGGANGTITSLLSIDGNLNLRWRDDDTVGPLSSTNQSDNYGYIGEKNFAFGNQIYSAGSFLTNGIASLGGGNPSGSKKVLGRLVGWENNVFFYSAPLARLIQNGELRAQYGFWRNNRADMGRGAFVPAVTDAPNGPGDLVTGNGPYVIENASSRPVPTAF